MRQVSPYTLWLGHDGDGTDFRLILEKGIQAVVQLAAEEPPLALPRELIYCRFPLLDGSGNDRKMLDLALTTVANMLEKRIMALVCCGGGSSRTPAVAAGALSMVYQESPDDFLKQIADSGPADVVPAFWNEVLAALESQRS
jgi:protein-tyrosine phosphatase